MLLWLRNLHFSGGSLVFFISGQIPVQYEATVSVQEEPAIPVKYEPTIGAQSDGEVSI